MLWVAYYAEGRDEIGRAATATAAVVVVVAGPGARADVVAVRELSIAEAVVSRESRSEVRRV